MTQPRKDVYESAAAPVRIGVLMDMPEWIRPFALKAYAFIIARAGRDDRFERGVELVEEVVEGAPSGPIRNALLGYDRLVDAGVLAVIGPNHSDHNKALTERVEARRVPALTLGATSAHLSDYVFNVQWGSIPEDAHIVANWLARNGHARVTVTWDTAWHSGEYLHHFRNAARRLGLRILTDERLSQLPGPHLDAHVARTVAEHRALNPDAIVHFATSRSGQAWARGVKAAGWAPPRIMNGGFYGATSPATADVYEGWVGTGLWDDENPTLAGLLAEYAAWAGETFPAPAELAALYFDGMRALLEGVALAPILTPEGVKRGLEDVKMLPAAIGGPRTVIGFGPWDRRGLKGMDVMVLRRMTGGRLVMEPRFDPMATLREVRP